MASYVLASAYLLTLFPTNFDFDHQDSLLFLAGANHSPVSDLSA